MTRRPKKLPDNLTDVLLDDLVRLIVRTQERMEREAGARLHVTFQIVPAPNTPPTQEPPQ